MTKKRSHHLNTVLGRQTHTHEALTRCCQTYFESKPQAFCNAVPVMPPLSKLVLNKVVEFEYRIKFPSPPAFFCKYSIPLATS